VPQTVPTSSNVAGGVWPVGAGRGGERAGEGRGLGEKAVGGPGNGCRSPVNSQHPGGGAHCTTYSLHQRYNIKVSIKLKVS
jgi:hypothetical protein